MSVKSETKTADNVAKESYSTSLKSCKFWVLAMLPIYLVYQLISSVYAFAHESWNRDDSTAEQNSVQD